MWRRKKAAVVQILLARAAAARGGAGGRMPIADDEDDFDSSLRERYVLSLVFLACFAWAVLATRSALQTLQVDTALASLLVCGALSLGILSLLAPSLALVVDVLGPDSTVNSARLIERMFTGSVAGAFVGLALLLPFAYLFEQAPSRTLLDRLSVTVVEVALGLVLVAGLLYTVTQFAAEALSAATVACIPGLACHLAVGPRSLAKLHASARLRRVRDEDRPAIRDEVERLTFEILVCRGGEQQKAELVRQKLALERALNASLLSWLLLVSATAGAPVALMCWPALHRGVSGVPVVLDLLLLVVYSSALAHYTLTRMARATSLGWLALSIAQACLLGTVAPLVAYFFSLGSGSLAVTAALFSNALWSHAPWPGLFLGAFLPALIVHWP